MYSKEELSQFPEYWMEKIQNELFRQLEDYMEHEGLNRKQLAERLNVSKGYISQILNGNSNFTLKKIVELALAIGRFPVIQLVAENPLLQKEEKGVKRTILHYDKQKQANIELQLDSPQYESAFSSAQFYPFVVEEPTPQYG